MGRARLATLGAMNPGIQGASGFNRGCFHLGAGTRRAIATATEDASAGRCVRD
jgi:hypothetical protein